MVKISNIWRNLEDFYTYDFVGPNSIDFVRFSKISVTSQKNVSKSQRLWSKSQKCWPKSPKIWVKISQNLKIAWIWTETLIFKMKFLSLTKIRETSTRIIEILSKIFEISTKIYWILTKIFKILSKIFEICTELFETWI